MNKHATPSAYVNEQLKRGPHWIWFVVTPERTGYCVTDDFGNLVFTPNIQRAEFIKSN